MVGGDTVRIRDFLVDKSDVVHFEIGWWHDNVIVTSTTLDLLEIGAAEKGNCFLDHMLLFDWRPQETDVSRAAALHHVKRGVDGLFLSNKPGKDFERACSLVSLLVTVVVDVVKVLLELVDGGVEQLARLSDFLFSVFNNRRNAAKFWDVEALTHEGIADLLDSVRSARNVLEDNHVDGLDQITLLEVGKERKSLSSGCSEDQHFESVLVLSFNCAGNKLNLSEHWLGSFVDELTW